MSQPSALHPADESLAQRLAAVACVDRPFTLPGGRRLPSYFDEYQLAADPRLLAEVAAAMASRLPANAEALAGVELGGIPLVVALSAATGLPAAFVRRTARRLGSRRQIEGVDVAGVRVALVDDVVRSGGRLVAMARVLRGSGARVSAALCVLERPLGGRRLLTDHGVTLHQLLVESELTTAARRS